ncbi:Trans-acting T-cell-specific transcription factor GATA-3 [Mortierella alpina]|nr:Trans-acting T-cell-specific transcription factor GATA-3 [Mortierella alpina]
MLPQYPPSYNNVSSLSNDHGYSYYSGSYPAMERFRRNSSNDPTSLSSSGSSMSSLLDRVPAVALAANHAQLPSSFPPLLAYTARSSSSSSSAFPSVSASNADGSTFSNNKQQGQEQHKTRRSLTKHELHAMDPDPKYCDNCRTTTTPSWRRCPLGRILFQKLHGRPRPFFKAKDGTIKIHRTLPDHTPCAICGTTQTPIWRKRPNNTVICNGCSLISKQSRSLVLGDGVEAHPFPSPPQSAHSGSAVYTTPGKKTRQRSRGKGCLNTTFNHKNEDDGIGSLKRSRHSRNSAITEVEARKKCDDAAAVMEFYSGYNSGYNSGVGAGTEVGACNTIGQRYCNIHGVYGACSCSQYLGASASTCDGRYDHHALVAATDALTTMPLDVTIAQ